MNFLLAFLVLGVLGLLLGVGLAIASRKFSVPVDPRVEQMMGILPGANCAACGFTGCALYAKAVVDGKAKAGGCPVGGQAVADKVAAIMGVEAGAMVKTVAFVCCNGDLSEKRRKGDYSGIPTCTASVLVSNGIVQCGYGCVGFGDCVKVCAFDAIHTRGNLPPLVDEKKCTSCGLCVAACPRDLISLIPMQNRYVVACSSHDKGKMTRQVCDVGCIACGLCVKKCPHKAAVMENNLARILPLECQNAGECFKVCPTKCIVNKDVGSE